MGRHRTDKLTLELLAARREAIKRMYFELGADRSFSKLMPPVVEKFGGPSRRVVMGWSAAEHWPKQAAEFDAQRAALKLQRAEEITEASGIDEVEVLSRIIQMRLKDIAGGALSLQEQRHAMGVVEGALRALNALGEKGVVRSRLGASFAGVPHEHSSSLTDDRAQRALEVLRERMLRPSQEQNDEAERGEGDDEPEQLRALDDGAPAVDAVG